MWHSIPFIAVHALSCYSNWIRHKLITILSTNSKSCAEHHQIAAFTSVGGLFCRWWFLHVITIFRNFYITRCPSIRFWYLLCICCPQKWMGRWITGLVEFLFDKFGEHRFLLSPHPSLCLPLLAWLSVVPDVLLFSQDNVKEPYRSFDALPFAVSNPLLKQTEQVLFISFQSLNFLNRWIIGYHYPFIVFYWDQTRSWTSSSNLFILFPPFPTCQIRSYQSWWCSTIGARWTGFELELLIPCGPIPSCAAWCWPSDEQHLGKWGCSPRLHRWYSCHRSISLLLITSSSLWPSPLQMPRLFKLLVAFS